jgi:hypothetical protein
MSKKENVFTFRRREIIDVHSPMSPTAEWWGICKWPLFDLCIKNCIFI